VRGGQRYVHVARLADRLAVVDRLQHRELAGALLQKPCDAVQVLRAVPAGQVAPDRLVRLAGGGHGTVHIGRSGRDDLGEHVLGGRVDGLEPAAIGGLDELAADEQPVRGADVHNGRGLRRGRVLEGSHVNPW
jgi:hypothetical protein